jgi:hypothetical protein
VPGLVQLAAGHAAEPPADVEQRRGLVGREQGGQLVGGDEGGGGAVIGHQASMPARAATSRARGRAIMSMA